MNRSASCPAPLGLAAAARHAARRHGAARRPAAARAARRRRARPSPRPCGIRSPGRRSGTWRRAAAARPSSCSRRCCRCRRSRRIHDATHSRPCWTRSRRVGSAPDAITVLVAAGLGRRARPPRARGLLRPDRARDFRGRIVVHDCEADDLRAVTVGRPRAADASGARRHRSRRHGRRRRDGPPRRPDRAARRVRAGCRSATAARAIAPRGRPARPAGVWPRSSRPGCARRPRSSASRSCSTTRAAPGSTAAIRGMPTRSRSVAHVSPPHGCSTSCPPDVRRRLLTRGRRRLDVVARPRRPAVGRARGGARPWHGRPQRLGHRAVRDARRPASVGEPPGAARASRPDHRRGARPRLRAAPLAQRTAARRGRHGRPPPPVLARDGHELPGAVPGALRDAA